MARKPKLKVYRLPIGFHDAYVAAPTKKAAIEAWGSDKDVFQREQAELVEDSELGKEPLASPGKVIKRLRGTAAEQVAALGEEELPKSAKTTASKAVTKGKSKAHAKPKPPPAPKPRPSRAALDEAEQALAEIEARHDGEREALAEREAALARERKALEKEQAQEHQRLEARRDKAASAYDKAMQRWRG